MDEFLIATPDSLDNDRKYMCSFTIQGRSYMIGGEKNSVAGDNRFRNYEIKQGRVVELDALQFPFNEGRCVVYGSPYPRVLACGGSTIVKCEIIFDSIETRIWPRLLAV